MAKKSGLGNLLLYNGVDISGDVSAVSISTPREVLDVTGISKSALERINGLSDASIEASIFFNDASSQAHLTLRGLPTTDVIVAWAMGTTVGDACAFLTAKQMNYDWSRGADGSLAGTVNSQLSSGTNLEYGNLLSAGLVTASSAASIASRDDGASTSNGAAAFLMIADINSGSPTVKVQESSNNSSWSDLINFSTVADGAEPSAERLSMSGSVARYLRITTTGTFSNCKFAVGIRRGTSVDDTSY